MKILNKKIKRELFRYNKARSFAIVFTLTLTVGFLFGLANSKQGFYDSYDLNMEKLNTPEIRLKFNLTIDASNITALMNNPIVQKSNIVNIEGRLIIRAKVNFRNKNYDAIWIALNSSKDNQNQVDKLRAVTGQNYFSGSNDAFILYQFGAGVFGQNVKMHEKMTLSIRNNKFPELDIVGIVQSNEYTYVVDDRTNFPTLGSMPIIYTSLEWAWDQLNSSHIINQMLVDTNELSEESADKALSIVTPLLSKQHAPIYNAQKTWEIPDYKMFNADAGSIDKFSIVLGGFALLIGIILVYNSLTKLVNSQRKYIGLMGAMGSNRKTIMSHYMSFGIILGIIGIIFGIMFSFLLTYLMSFMMLKIYGFHWIAISYNPYYFLGGTLITLGAIIFFSFLASLPILNITPREAMTSTFTRAGLHKIPILEKIFKRIPGFKSLSTSIPLRETFMNKKRSSLTIIAIAVSSVILIISGAFITDMVLGIDKNFNEYAVYDGKVFFNNIAFWDDVSTNLSKLDAIDHYEPIFYLPVAVNRTKDTVDQFLGYTPVEAVPSNSSLRNYHIIEGRAPSITNTDTPEVLIGNVISEDWNVSVNDKLTLYMGEIGISIKVKVVGVVGELIDVNLYTYTEIVESIFNSFGFTDHIVNGFMFSLTNSYDEQTFIDLENQFYDQFSVLQIENAVTNHEALQQLFEVLIEIGGLFMVVGVIMVVAFTFNTIYVAYSDREMEYLALRAQGMKRRTLLKIISLETLFFGTIGFLISIPLGYLASSASFDYMVGGTYYVELVIPLDMWLSLFVLTLGSVMLAALLVARRVNKAKMPDVLRNRQIG